MIIKVSLYEDALRLMEILKLNGYKGFLKIEREVISRVTFETYHVFYEKKNVQNYQDHTDEHTGTDDGYLSEQGTGE